MGETPTLLQTPDGVTTNELAIAETSPTGAPPDTVASFWPAKSPGLLSATIPGSARDETLQGIQFATLWSYSQPTSPACSRKSEL